MSIDVTDATFEAEVLDRSVTTPVVIDLWAPWCGPCRTLGPILDKVVDATDGQVVLAKVNIDENPKIAAAFQAQSIPAVHGIKDRKRVAGFIGAQGEVAVAQFVDGLLPSETERELTRLVAAGDEGSLRAALELDPGHEVAIVALAEVLVATERAEEALGLLERIPETAETRRVAALARTGGAADADDIDSQLTDLPDRVKGDDDARQQFVDLLEVLGADDPRTAEYRKKLTARLY